MKVRLVITGRSYDAAEAIPDAIELPEGASVDDALTAAAKLIAGGKGLPDSCLIAVSGTHLGTLADHQPHTLADGDELVVIAPVAGG